MENQTIEDYVVVKEGYRTYFLMPCKKCQKEMKVRNDYVEKHSGVCTSCQKKNNTMALKHGGVGKRLYRIWAGLKHRNYKRYNPSVCKEWSSYETFENWAIENGYAENLTIDRIDNDGDYKPENCQWITIEENAGKDKKIFSYEEEVRITHDRKVLGLTQREMADFLNVSRNTIQRAERRTKNDRKH